MTVFSILLMALAVELGLLRRWRWRQPAAAATLAALLIWTWTPFATVLAGTLEWQFPARPAPEGNADAIVVLGGSFYTPDRQQREMLPGYGTYMRCRHAAALYREWKAVPVVVAAGPVRGMGGQTLDSAGAMKHAVEAEGVPASNVWTTGDARTTYENALDVERLLSPKGVRRIALVTEAAHMPRAYRTFVKRGFQVTAAPCGYRTIRFESSWEEWLAPQPQSILSNEASFHEWAGLLWYIVSGKA